MWARGEEQWIEVVWLREADVEWESWWIDLMLVGLVSVDAATIIAEGGDRALLGVLRASWLGASGAFGGVLLSLDCQIGEGDLSRRKGGARQLCRARHAAGSDFLVRRL